uniref:Uncharacterized protein n=1 Tax=Solanum lycopersicum TaxID=4081 RepID=A0A3Q7J9J2_SOLLC
MKEGEAQAYGIVVNSFEKLKPQYVQGVKKAKGNETTFGQIGHVSLCNKEEQDKVERGNKASIIDEHHCLKWLDSIL